MFRTPVDMVRVKLVVHVIKTLGRIVHGAARVLDECYYQAVQM